MKQTKVILLFLLLALLVRLFFLFPQYSGDVKNHLVWGNSFLKSPDGFYALHFEGFNDANYPPLAIFLFALSNLLLLAFRNFFQYLNNLLPVFPSFLVPLFNHENIQYGFLKLPGIFADLGIGFLLFKFSSAVIPGLTRNPSKLPYVISALYLFNPAVIYLSSVWGQIEPVTNFFLLLSLYSAFVSSNTTKSFPRSGSQDPERLRGKSIPNIHSVYSIVFFTLAALTKQTALWFAPFYLFIWFKEIPYKSLLSGAVSSLLLFFMCYLPFGLLPLSAIMNYFATLSGSSSGVSDAAWNFWYLLFPSGAEDSIRLGLFSVRQISIILLIFLLVLLLYKLSKNYQPRTFLNYLFLWSLAIFFLQTRVHERHLAPALVFGLLAFVESPAWWLSYLGLSLFHFLNLFLTLKIPFI